MRSSIFRFSPATNAKSALRIVLVVLLLLGAFAAGMLLRPGMTRAQAASQCVACHTDAGKLQALTPPDPPSAEEGEG